MWDLLGDGFKPPSTKESSYPAIKKKDKWLQNCLITTTIGTTAYPNIDPEGEGWRNMQALHETYYGEDYKKICTEDASDKLGKLVFSEQEGHNESGRLCHEVPDIDEMNEEAQVCISRTTSTKHFPDEDNASSTSGLERGGERNRQDRGVFELLIPSSKQRVLNCFQQHGAQDNTTTPAMKPISSKSTTPLHL